MSEAGLLQRAAASAQVFVDDLETLAMTKGDAHHLFAVRRIKDGEELVASDGGGSWRMTVAKDGALSPTGDVIHEPAPSASITVAFAPVKGDRSDWAVTKLTELGCDRIVALKTDRSVVRWSDDATDRALSRWDRLAREACCQSRRVRLPLIEGPIGLDGFSGGAVALGVPGATPLDPSITTVLIGPEGGWSDAERERGIQEVTLSSQILRTETAAIAAGVLMGALRQGTVSAMGKKEDL
jgi:16S rRNA (uracil1498-N3)-methyltransferase